MTEAHSCHQLRPHKDPIKTKQYIRCSSWSPKKSGPYWLTMKLCGAMCKSLWLTIGFMHYLVCLPSCAAGTGGSWTFEACCHEALCQCTFYGQYTFYMSIVQKRSTVHDLAVLSLHSESGSGRAWQPLAPYNWYVHTCFNWSCYCKKVIL